MTTKTKTVLIRRTIKNILDKGFGIEELSTPEAFDTLVLALEEARTNYNALEQTNKQSTEQINYLLRALADERETFRLYRAMHSN